MQGHSHARPMHIYPEMAAAGLWTTATDLAKVGIELQKIHHGNYGGILKHEHVDAMLAPDLAPNIGLGFFIWNIRENVYIGHSGQDEGFIALMIMSKSGGKGLVVMINSVEGAPLVDEIERAVAKGYNWPGFFPDKSKPVQKDKATLNSYVGTYRSDKNITASVSELNGELFLNFQQQPSIKLVPRNDGKFYLSGLNANILFEMKEGLHHLIFYSANKVHQLH